MTTLSVLYDETCGFCIECSLWLERQPQMLPLQLVPKGSPAVATRWPGLDVSADELVVISGEGGIYRGPAAFLMCLYALERYRAWSLRLAAPALLPLARKAFELVSKRRHRIAEWLRIKRTEELAEEINRAVGPGTPRCAAPVFERGS